MSVTRALAANWKAWARTVHIYASLLGLVLALFFGTTGFMLNHGDWFGVEATRKETVEGGLDPRPDPADALAVVEAVRARFEVSGALASYEVDPEQVRLRFARPGEVTDVVVERRDGSARVERERGGLASLLTDLHKGDHSGSVGKRLIDATAILLLTISLTGFALWLTLPKRRRLGLLALGLTLGVMALSGLYVLA